MSDEGKKKAKTPYEVMCEWLDAVLEPAEKLEEGEMAVADWLEWIGHKPDDGKFTPNEWVEALVADRDTYIARPGVENFDDECMAHTYQEAIAELDRLNALVS
jgi:hypothetical protein